MKRRHPEAAIQRAVFEHLRLRGVPGLFYFHPFSGGYRRPIEAAIYKSLGAIAGLPDIIAIKDGHCYCLELKAPGGRLSPAQEQALIALRAAGAIATHVHGLDQALEWLERHELLRGRVS